MSKRAIASIVSVVLAAAVLALPVTTASAQTSRSNLGPVKIERFGAADRYSTSLWLANSAMSLEA